MGNEAAMDFTKIGSGRECKTGCHSYADGQDDSAEYYFSFYCLSHGVDNNLSGHTFEVYIVKRINTSISLIDRPFSMTNDCVGKYTWQSITRSTETMEYTTGMPSMLS